MLCAWVLGMASTTAQANQATIFLLDDTNAAQVATAVLNTLQNNAPPYPGNTLSHSELTQFFNAYLNNPVYSFNPTACPSPGTRVFFNNSGELSFRFDNFANNGPQALFVASLNYIDPNPALSPPAVFCPSVYQVVNLSMGNLQYNILLIGALTTPSPSTFNQAHGRFEIVIIDKNVL